MRSTALLAVLTLLAGLAPAAPAAAGESAPAAVYPQQVIDQDFPDPDVFQKNGTWYAYSTNNWRGHLPTASASSPTGPWRLHPDGMPGGPSPDWAEGGRTWAPDVFPNPDGSYTLTYTAKHRTSGRQCIGVATATNPLGPFQPAGGAPLICPLELGGAIDANTFVDSDGIRYLVWKNDGNAIGQASTLWLTRTSHNGTRLVSGHKALISSSGVIEAPDLVRRNNRYVLFFSGGSYTGCGYLTSYATAASLDGPWTVAAKPLMTTASFDGKICGPGGADFHPNRVFVHGWVGDQRLMFVADFGWADDLPVVRGSRYRVEAETGTLSNARIRPAGTASGGHVVAYIDHADSWVENRVYSPAGGASTLTIGYANGSGATATHQLFVNGNNLGTVGYQSAGWDQWRQVAVAVTLRAGWNTVRLAKGSLYTEVDYLEVQ